MATDTFCQEWVACDRVLSVTIVGLKRDESAGSIANGPPS